VNVGSVQILQGEAPEYFHPGRSGTLRQGKVILAHFGELHPAVLDKMNVKQALSGCEVFLENIPTPRSKSSARKALKMASLQPLYRDFAFVVDDGVAADQLLRAVRSGDKKLIVDAHIFDVYQGKGIAVGQKSLAVQITLQPIDVTLKDEDLEQISKSVITAVLEKTGGVLRG
jgi:phenylalanyl-tRNA synthetase beta chain